MRGTRWACTPGGKQPDRGGNAPIARLARSSAILLALVPAACSKPGSTTRDGATAATTASTTPAQSITGFDASAGHGGRSVDGISRAARADPATVRKAALLHLHDGNAAVRYAALYGLALTATAQDGAAELAGLLTSSDPDERLLSAATLAGIGDKRGLPVLIDALGTAEQLRFRDPPQPAFAFARTQLLWLTQADFGLGAASDLDAAKVAAAQPAWRRWWRANEATVHRDPAKRKFVP